MKFVNGIIEGAAYNPAKEIGGSITPILIVVHDTASSLTKGNAANYLRDNDRQVSVHFVVERDGTFEQQVPINRRANHAGVSSYNGRSGANGFSVGIEIVNPGTMSKSETPGHADSYGKPYSIKDYDIREAKALPNGGMAFWMNYTKEQLATVFALCKAIADATPSIKDVQPHWYISPGRKVDTSPLFPLEELRFETFKGERKPDDPTPTTPVSNTDKAQLITDLNLRKWPSFNPNVIAVIPAGTVLEITKSGNFSDEDATIRKWLHVNYQGVHGWIVDDIKYLKHVFI